MVPFLKYQTSLKGARQILLKGVFAVKGGITPNSVREKMAKRSVKGGKGTPKNRYFLSQALNFKPFWIILW